MVRRLVGPTVFAGVAYASGGKPQSPRSASQTNPPVWAKGYKFRLDKLAGFPGLADGPMRQHPPSRRERQRNRWADDLLNGTSHRSAMTGKIDPNMCTPQDPCGPGTSGEIVENQVSQTKYYYCAPAAVHEALDARDVEKTQDVLAQDMGTTTDGTDWYNGTTYPVRDELNSQLSSQGAQYHAVNLDYTPTQTQINTYETHLTADIQSAWPVIGNAYEVAGGPHLVGHPKDLTIYHYVELRGYTSSGDYTKYEDSVHGASSISWSAGVPAYSTLSSQTIATIFGGRGYIW